VKYTTFASAMPSPGRRDVAGVLCTPVRTDVSAAQRIGSGVIDVNEVAVGEAGVG